ncbi:hypothetical protein [Phytopseudomonas dryadis]|uniref:Lipoprotein n=1 Tax=Phytopseudomonas dryadis TaxID=2487520 RepID=A0A4Q9R4D2_9GAMM|nr:MULTISPECIES: hypothetical protein [Pseudomonas]TBU95356.1 hypothetical protein DNK44_07285 [Pseudomonas dryadis]TBV08217.1 hypothetical protein DNK34_05655 [Pseudomonas dryadis]TBV19781.1 hypothetical protein DNK41_01920 [Pseudomonas sp. FRB 230]
MNRLMPIALAITLLSVAGCTLQRPAAPGGDGSIPPSGSPPVSKSHPRFAPPPGVDSHWDGALGVYVLAAERDTYYRERTFYRWNNGWSWAGNLQGPWQPVDSSGVPPALFRHHGQ